MNSGTLCALDPEHLGIERRMPLCNGASPSLIRLKADFARRKHRKSVNSHLMQGPSMLDKILIPTDGSETSMNAAAWAVQLAKKAGGKLTAVHVTAPAGSIMVGEVNVVRQPDVYEKHAAEQAAVILNKVAALAQSAGVPFEGVHVRDEYPWHGILATAKSEAADLIVIASQTRGLAAILIGSQTQKVVQNSTVPVVVYR